MKKIIFAVIIFGLVAWAVFDYLSSPDDETAEDTSASDNAMAILPDKLDESEESDEIGLNRGEIAPDFELTTLKGETVKLSDFRGKRVFLNFWATWCPPCRAEMPDMQRLYENEDVEILAVNMTETETNVEGVAEFVDDFGLTFPILMDDTSQAMFTYLVSAYPTSYMIDSNGRIQFIALGAMNYDLMMQQLEMMD